LDRIVVDECYVMPDGKNGFRLQMQMLEWILRKLGVQMVFLTAMLAPQNEGVFYGVLGLDRRRVRMFRSWTTRKNIEYRVEAIARKGNREKEEDRRVCEIVRQWKSRQGQGGSEEGKGKAIVYGGRIERVERLERILSCEVYHSKVDITEEKARRLKSWMGFGKLIVATNALGLGIDVGNV